MRRGVLRAALAGCLALLASSCTTVERARDGLKETLAGGSAAAGSRVSFQSEPEIRVRVLKDSARLKVDGPETLIVRAAGGGRSERYAAPIVIQSGASGLKIADGKNRVREWPFGADVEVLASDAGAGTVAPRLNQSMRINGVRHPGFALVRPRWGDAPTQFDVIVITPVESYLAGVIAGEMPKNWPRQAYEAQAVAARTYALHERERARRESRAFDVDANTNDQVYTGTVTAPAAVEAVNATRGTVLLHQGALLRAYFSSTCGGRPSSAADVWPTGAGYEFNLAPPLQGRARPAACQESKFYRWTVERDDQDLSQRLRQWGRVTKHEIAELTRIRKIEVSARNDALRPVQFRISDSGGRAWTMKAEELRMASNQSAGSLPPITDANRVLSGDFEADVWATRVRFRGRGWGHGVGMCQHCARQFAEDGQDWRGMMPLFYPGAEIKKIY